MFLLEFQARGFGITQRFRLRRFRMCSGPATCMVGMERREKPETNGRQQVLFVPAICHWKRLVCWCFVSVPRGCKAVSRQTGEKRQEPTLRAARSVGLNSKSKAAVFHFFGSWLASSVGFFVWIGELRVFQTSPTSKECRGPPLKFWEQLQWWTMTKKLLF